MRGQFGAENAAKFTPDGTQSPDAATPGQGDRGLPQGLCRVSEGRIDKSNADANMPRQWANYRFSL